MIDTACHSKHNFSGNNSSNGSVKPTHHVAFSAAIHQPSS